MSDLSHDTDWTTLWTRINETSRSRWLYNAKAQDEYEVFEEQLSALIKAAEVRDERERREAERRQKREKDQLKRALSELKTLCALQHVEVLTQAGENHPAWLYHSRYLPFVWNELPDFLNVQVPNGDWIYGCDRRVWQSALYSYFIRKRRKPFSVRAADHWLQRTVGCQVPRCATTVAIYGRRYPAALPPELADNLPTTWKTIGAYCDVLCRLQMLSFSGTDRKYPGSRWYTVLGSVPAVSAHPVAA